MQDLPKMPHDAVAEQIVLGNCFKKQSSSPLGTLELRHFYSDVSRRVAAEIRAMHDAGEPINTLALIQRLEGKVLATNIFDLDDPGVPEVGDRDLEYYRNRIIRTFALRQLAAETRKLQDAYLSGVDETVKEAEARFESVRTECRAHSRERVQITFVDSTELLQRTSADDEPYLVQGLIPVQSHTIWQGRPKIGKSHTLLQIAFDASCGRPVFGRFEVQRALRVVYVELEEPESETAKRLDAIIRAHDSKGPEAGRLRFFSREDLYRLRLLSHELLTHRFDDFAEALRCAQPDLVILVALRKFVPPGNNISDPDVAEAINSRLNTLRRETRAALLVGHHVRKNPATTVEAQGLGSTMIGAEADGVFDLSRRRDGTREVRFEGRFRVEEERFCLELAPCGEGEVIAHAAWQREDEAAKEELRRRVGEEGQSVNRAAKEMGIPKSTAYHWMEE